MAVPCLVCYSRRGAGNYLTLPGINYFVHIGKQIGYQSFGEILCPHLLDGPIRMVYTEHGDMKILPKFFLHLPI